VHVQRFGMALATPTPNPESILPAGSLNGAKGSQAVPKAVASSSAYLMHAPRDARQVFGFEGWSQEFGVHAALLGRLDPSAVSSSGTPVRVRFTR